MKEWKFRGFDAVGDKGWVYGDLVHNQKVTKTGLVPRVMVGGYEVSPESVGLSVCMKDKKGNDIYDGDIVYIEFADGSHGHYIVGWNDKMSGFGLMDSYSHQSIKDGYDNAIFNPWLLMNMRTKSIIFQVVGSLFADKELLEKNYE